MSDDCRVFGNIKNPLGYPLQDDIEVAAFCLYYRESVDSAGAKIGTFEKAMLGNPAIPDTFGHYEIVYNASSIPQGLRLDSKIAKGKDKASLFAEVHYKNGGEGNDSPRSFYSAPLVFNGKSAQEINFVLDLETDKPIESEFERLDNVLKIYCQTVVSYKETIKVSCQDKISEFLDSVTRFPLVIGREDVDEAKTRAYFKSFQIAYELVDSVEGLRGALVSGITPISEEFQIVSVCAAYLYPLIRNAKVIDVSTLLATGLDECKKVIQEAISANLISSKLSADEFRLKIWNYLQKSKNVATEQENTFSAFFVFYLFLAKELELESNEFANAGSIKKNGKGGRPKLTRLGEHQERLDSLLDLFSDCGSSYQDLIASLKEDSSMFSSAEVEDLKFLIELGDFCNWYPDLVVSAYTLLHKENSPYKPCAKSDSLVSEEDLPGAWKLEYLLKYGDASGSEPNFWGEVIEKTAERYACWCREVALALPLDLFPGTTANEQKQIAIRTLKERLRAKFPQTELKLKLSEAFSADDSEKPWKDLVWKLQSEPWTDFDLNASDLEVFLKKSSAAHAQDDGIPEATASDDEKEKIRILQRLFRLTNNPQAIAYLVRNDFDSASKIALSDEENFVAKHGLGMGDKELATDIHRLAKNFVANATLDIERYHGNLNESDNTILSLPRGLQNESLSSQRARSLARNVRSVGNNVAKRRLQNKDYANWKTLFGSINRNSGTQNHTLHIVGRTRGEPHAYYYRRYEATALYGGNWTPWEEVPVEIDGAAIQPAILGGHLYITWLQVIQGQRQKKTGESGGKQAAVSVEYYAELRLKWTAFTGVKWTGVKVGKQAVYDVSENQLDFILGENESLAERYFVIDVSDNSDALSLQVWRTFPDFVDTPHVVTVPVANSAPMVGDVEGLDNAPATTYILKTEVSREYRADQRINHVGNFSLAQDGSDTASNQVEPNTGNPIAFTYGEFVKNHSPSGCRLVGNLFYNAGGSLVLQDGTKIFGNTRGPFKLLSVNMGFICHEDRPFFYMDSKGVFLVRTVSGDGGSGANSIPNYHVEMVSNPQAGEFRRRFLQGGPKWLYSRETEALPVSDSYYYSYSYYNYYFSVYLGYYTAGDWQAWDLSQTLFEHGYLPGSVVAEPYPSSTVDFCWGSATSIYNWELFFFVPMLLADRMLAEQNYEAALNWLQLVFDPRIDLTPYERTKRFVRELSKGARYWKFLPFFANPDADRSILSELSFPTPHDALPDRKAIQLLIDRWKNDPFNPQMIARYRPRLPEICGDEISRCPDRLGRPTVLAGHDGIGQPGGADVHSRGGDSRTEERRGSRPKERHGVQRAGADGEGRGSDEQRVRHLRGHDAHWQEPREGDAPAASARLHDAACAYDGDDVLFQRAPQRDAGGLLGHRGGQALQDSQQPQHGRRKEDPCAVCAAYRPDHAREGESERGFHQRGAHRRVVCAAVLSL